MSFIARFKERLAQVGEPKAVEQADEIRLYSASWCQYCKRVTPTFRKLRRQYPKQLKLVDLSDKRSRRWDQDHIRVVPTLVALRNGEVVDRKSGPFTAGGMSQWVTNRLKPEHH